MNKDLFAHKSKGWDKNSKRVKGARAIADGIIENIELKNEMHIMDFGAGTGLLSYCLADTVAKITAVDNSPSMLEVFYEKSSQFSCVTEVLEFDLSQDVPNGLFFDGIVSSMTIHHLEDTEDMLHKMYAMLNNGGFIALADLESEDGTFHSDNTGVFHFGFDTNTLIALAQKVGFKDINIERVNIIQKPHRDFPVFLLSAKK